MGDDVYSIVKLNAKLLPIIMNVIESIAQRQTIKVLASESLPIKETDHALIEQLIGAAYWAPFHKPCDSAFRSAEKDLTAIMPWRFYVLDSKNCRHLAEYLAEKDICMGKIEPMLNAADYLIQATWTPNNADNYVAANLINKEKSFEGSLENMEHIAAAGAAIQNVLLTATHLGLDNYWSSGGCLRHEEVFNKMAINVKEILLGSLFIFPKENCEKLQRLPSKLRDKRGRLSETYRMVSF